MDSLILIVGCGGIGSNLFQKISRYAPLNYHICLIDGDTVEPKNLQRQMFTQADVGKNKAECLAHKANNQLGQRFSYYPYYLETSSYKKFADQVREIILHRGYSGNLVVFGCLDNHPARLMLEKMSKDYGMQRFDNYLYIDGANEEYTGDVVSYFKTDRSTNKNWGKVIKEYGVFRSAYDYNVMIDKTNDPNNSCQNDLLEGNIQTLIANDKAAITMLEVFNNFLDGRKCWGLWKFKATRPQTKRKSNQ